MVNQWISWPLSPYVCPSPLTRARPYRSVRPRSRWCAHLLFQVRSEWQVLFLPDAGAALARAELYGPV
ncbi:MAG: hypothetical protein ACRD0Q_00625, partial [Acidimicrobiales bacterium]